MRLKRIQAGVYRLGSYEIWRERRSLWRVWDDDAAGSGEGYRTLREAQAAIRAEVSRPTP